MKFAAPLSNSTLAITGVRFRGADDARSKSEVGHAIEAFFGIPKNARSEADFPAAGIELKVLPLRRVGTGLSVKERTVISMIDFDHIIEETWDDAKVRAKLNILFVFFEHLPARPKSEFPILDVMLWHPDARTNTLLRADWERVRTKVRQGLAHKLSESDGRIMGPCTKGKNAGSLRSQPFGSELAMSRAFALKPSFTLELFRESQRRSLRREVVDVDDPTKFEDVLLDRFRPFVGQQVDDVADALGMPRSDGKSYAATVARRIFGARSFKNEIKEFAEMGLTPRITRVNDELMPYEATSFPAFRYREVIQETWEDSDLLARVEYMLFIPVHGHSKDDPQGRCRFGQPRFWRPTSGDLELIRREWELYLIEIERGMADSLTPATGTLAIHVRPHARNAKDTDDAPGVGSVVKKSFWLNRSFVSEILQGKR